MKPLRAGTCGAVLALLAGCGTEPSPILGIQGTWSLQFSAASTTLCPAPQPFPPACGGTAILQFTADGDRLSATGSGRVGCNDCRGASDFLVREPVVTVAGANFTLEPGPCELTGPLPAETADTASGTATCEIPGAPTTRVTGTWQMLRVRR
jgi:hypothetical protein